MMPMVLLLQTHEREGPAWGTYSFIGRVRPWDGFVVLLRIPVRENVWLASFISSNPLYHQTNPAHSYTTGRWIFKGYIHERSLVGRWRETGTAVDQLGYEGGFVLCKVDDKSGDVP